MRRRKLYYVPGLISVIGLPILLLFMDPENIVYHTVLRLNLPTTKRDSPGIKRFSGAGFFKLIKKKKRVTVDVNDYVWDERTGLWFRKFTSARQPGRMARPRHAREH